MIYLYTMYMDVCGSYATSNDTAGKIAAAGN